MIIFLCGNKAVGKSKFGKLIARKYSIPWYDLDDVVIDNLNKEGNDLAADGKIPEECLDSGFKSAFSLYRDIGESAFRKEEYSALKNLLFNMKEPNVVISLGCGAGEAPKLLELCNSAGVTVYLKGNEEESYKRVLENYEKEYIDSITKKDFHKKFLKRNKIYSNSCNVVVDVEGASDTAVLESIIEKTGAQF